MDSSTQKNSWMIPLAGFSGFILACIGFGWYFHAKGHVWTNDAYLDGYQVSISADIEGRITDLYVDEGDVVKAGDLVCKLDDSIYSSQREDALTHVAFLEESVRRQKIEMEKLYDIYQVAQHEFEHQIIPYIEFDKVEKDYQFSVSSFKLAEANLANGIAKLGVVDELIRHTHIYAPRDGAISKRWVVAGDVAKIGQPVFGLTDLENIWVTANLEETKVASLQPGDPVDIHVDAYPNHHFSGSVLVVRAAAASQFSLIPPDNATGNFTKVIQRVPVKILLQLPQTKDPLYLYPGMSVEIKVKTK